LARMKHPLREMGGWEEVNLQSMHDAQSTPQPIWSREVRSETVSFPDQLKWRGTISKRGALKLIKINYYMGDKIRTFCSSIVRVGKIAEDWGQSTQSLAIFYNFFFSKITHFKRILIQIFAW